MKNAIAAGLMMLALGLNGQKFSVMFHYGDSLLSENAFEHIDTSSAITTGVLWDRIVPNILLPAYTGSSEDTALGGHITGFQAAMDLRRAALDTNILPGYDSLANHFERLAFTHNALPLILYDFDYDLTKDYVVDSNLISLDTVSGKLVLGPNFGESPFEQMNFFALGFMSSDLAVQDTLRFVLPTDFYFSNTGQTINSIEIDMKDGQGFRNISLDAPFEVYYPGEGGNALEIEFKVTYEGQGTKYSKVTKKLKQAGCAPPMPVNGPWLGDFVLLNTPMKYGFQAPNGSWGNAYVWYRDNPDPGEENKFRKPLILVEGIDFGKAVSLSLGGWRGSDGVPIGSSRRLGDAGWPTIWNCQPDDYPFQEFPDFLLELHQDGYDLIFLDFGDGADDMRNNGMLLVDLIQKVNQYKVGNEGNVVVGASMGGQVARYALSYMEANDIEHCTRLFASFDSPWQGAHIPLAVQRFMKYAAEEIDDDDAKDKLKALNTKAAKQLLKFHYSAFPCAVNKDPFKLWRHCHYPGGTNSYPHPMRTAFMNDVQNLGSYPLGCRNVAISNGNNQGNATFANGKQFTDYSKTWSCLFPVVGYVPLNFRFDLYSMGRGDNMISDLKYPFKRREHTYVSGLPMIDNAPGGQRDDITDIQENLNEGFKGWWNCINKGSVSMAQDKFNFIPTISALNINTNDLYFDVSQINVNNPSEFGHSHFDAFHAAVSDEEHVEGTAGSAGNLDWLINQILLGENKLESDQNGVLTKMWNLPLEASLLQSVDVNSGGTLYVNADKPRFDEPDVPENYSPSGGIAKVRIGGHCSTTEIININTGGKMILGEQGTTNRAYVYVSDGAEINISGGELLINKDSRLIVEDGGKLIVNTGGLMKLLDQGEIIIEDGGEIIFNYDSDLELTLSQSVLDIKGKFTLWDNTNFTFTGSGRIIFDQDIPWVNDALDFTDYYHFGDNCSIKIEGSDPADIHLEVKKPAYWIDANNATPAGVEIYSTTVKLHPGALLYSYSATLVDNAVIEGTVSHPPHGGFRLWHDDGFSRIRNTTVRNGSLGVFVDCVNNPTPLVVEDCIFEENGTALRITGGDFVLRWSTLKNNGFGLLAEGIQGASSVTYNKFNSNTTGALLEGSNNTDFEVSNNEFNYNNPQGSDGIGLSLWQARAHLNCNEFVGNEIGIKVHYAKLYMHENAYNYFYGNDLGVKLESGFHERPGIYLRDGFNEFLLGPGSYPNRLHLLGSFAWQDDFASSLPYSEYVFNSSTGYEELHAENNRFQMREIQSDPGEPCCIWEMPVDLSVVQGSSPGPSTKYPIKLYLPQNLSSVQRDCESGTSGDPDHPVVEYLQGLTAPQQGGTVSTTGLSVLTSLLNGIDELSYGETQGDDLLALQTFQGVLTSNITNTDQSTGVMLEHAYELMLAATENSFMRGQLSHTGGEYSQEKPAAMQATLDIIDDHIGDLNPQDCTFVYWNFKHHLDKVMTHRNGGYYPEALQILAYDGLWATGTQLNRTGYWDCICQAEKGYYDGTLDPGGLSEARENCQILFSGATYKTLPGNDHEERQGYTLSKPDIVQSLKYYPQPVDEMLSLELPESFAGRMTYRIHNSNGQELQAGTIDWNGGFKHDLDVSQLPPGIHLLQLQSDQTTKSFKINKI